MAVSTALATLAQVKARLQITTTAFDLSIDVLRAAIEEKVLERTGFALSAALPQSSLVVTDTLVNIQRGRVYTLKYRPIDETLALVFTARAKGSTSYEVITGTVVDAWRGRVSLDPADAGTALPPTPSPEPWFRWREMTWPFVRVAYKVDPVGSATNPHHAALTAAVVEWTAFVYAKTAAGAVGSVSMEGVSESYVAESEPKVVATLLAKYLRDQVAMHS